MAEKKKTFYEIVLECNKACIEAITYVDQKTGKRYLNEMPTHLVVSPQLYEILGGKPIKLIEDSKKEEG